MSTCCVTPLLYFYLPFSILFFPFRGLDIWGHYILETVVLALVNERNEQSATIQWQFTPALARQKFQRFYPVLDTDSDDQPVS
ncbi:hypothetical protein KFU94_22345 [Chloroflexi bacterium TSY]|nr:hypothetical protein [Chloroflexi bacterium TSY]